MITLLAGRCARIMGFLIVANSLIGSASAFDAGDLQKQLTSLYPPAKATADGTDLVSAGAVLVLAKDNLVMCTTDQPFPSANFYKNGAINQGGLGGLVKVMGALGHVGGGAQPTGTRTFVAGEKFFVTRILSTPDGVTFTLMSDPIKDQRYKATLKFIVAKGTSPSPDDMLASVAEVFKVDSGGGGAAPEQASAGAPPAAPAATKTIAIGQSRDQVVAAFGVPTKTVQLGAKEIDFFSDMKVTFVNNKVSNVE